ncbi:MAG: cardiolipin synthase [Culturomica sp.]|jgi:cardiolipin synthase|nr:cardiolipin synthase [Culturomica sp.]
MEWYFIILIILAVLYVLLVVSICLTVIMENRNPVRTLAWILVVMLLPLIGVVLYGYFGINYRKRKIFSMKGLGDIKWLQYMSEDQNQLIKKAEFLKKEEMANVRKLMTLLLNNSKALLTRHNKLDILNNGLETFPALFAALSKAKKYIHLEYYILEDGLLMTRLKEILIEKARAGVEVRVIYDDMGGWKLSNKIISELSKAGVQIYPFLPVRFHKFANKANYRNHRKIAVIDGETAFVGGLNIADRYLFGLTNGQFWRDTHLRVRGEAVVSLQTIFLVDWYFVCQELLLDKNEYLPVNRKEGNIVVQTVSSGPDSDWSSIQQAYFTLINTAKRYVLISSPYFMPGETTLNCMKAAAMGGVDVRLLLPQKSDSVLTHWCSRSFVEELMDAGVKVYWYKKGINHSKVIVVDGVVASVGTANMDNRSFEQNFEVNLIIYDSQVSKQLAGYFMEDLKDSEEENPYTWRFRPKSHKIKESLARLFSPLL